MSIITDLKEQVKDKSRVNVYLDNEFFCGLELETVLKYHIKIGDNIDSETIQKLQFDSEGLTAINKCVNLISKRFKTEKEIVTYLKTKGYKDLVIDFVINKLKEYNLINDERYTQSFIQSNLEKYGKNALKNKLLAKGIDKTIISDVMDKIEPQTNEIMNLFNKFMKNKELTPENKRKAINRLMYRGFSYDEIKSSISILNED